MRSPFRKKSAPASNTHRYGTLADGTRNTIHASGDLSIEIDDTGCPTAVWFRCLNLPFHVWHRDFEEPAYTNPTDMTILNIEYTTQGEPGCP